MHDAISNGGDGRSSAVMDVEFVEQRLQASFHSVFANRQLQRHLFVAQKHLPQRTCPLRRWPNSRPEFLYGMAAKQILAG